MKIKHYAVEYILYVSQGGYPGVDWDYKTRTRSQFSTKKEAKDYIKRFLDKDPEFVQMWVARITLHTLVEKVEVFAVPRTVEKLSLREDQD